MTSQKHDIMEIRYRLSALVDDLDDFVEDDLDNPLKSWFVDSIIIDCMEKDLKRMLLEVDKLKEKYDPAEDEADDDTTGRSVHDRGGY